MKSPQDLSISDYQYELPEARIANYPLAERSSSKLLVYRHGKIVDAYYDQLPGYVSADTVLYFNNSKVVEARLLFRTEGGQRVEVFCLEPDATLYQDVTMAMQTHSEVQWICMVGGAKKWKEHIVLEKLFSGVKGTVRLQARLLARRQDSFLIHFSWDEPSWCFAEMLHHMGVIPLPPYIKRESESQDSIRYQTVYAQQEGSVAAPTAGLHFTDALLQQLANKGIEKHFLTLHVGAGTFKPVKSAQLKEHTMHAEYMDVSLEMVDSVKNASSKKIIPVGTTAFRTLESLYWMGVKVIQHPNAALCDLEISQWEAYAMTATPSRSVAFEALSRWMQKNQMSRLFAKTSLLVAPGYDIKVCDAIITNFHQPGSTLILLVACFVGDEWRAIYQHALDNDYRFLSFGDGSLLWKK